MRGLREAELLAFVPPWAGSCRSRLVVSLGFPTKTLNGHELSSPVPSTGQGLHYKS